MGTSLEEIKKRKAARDMEDTKKSLRAERDAAVQLSEAWQSRALRAEEKLRTANSDRHALIVERDAAREEAGYATIAADTWRERAQTAETKLQNTQITLRDEILPLIKNIQKEVTEQGEELAVAKEKVESNYNTAMSNYRLAMSYREGSSRWMEKAQGYEARLKTLNELIEVYAPHAHPWWDKFTAALKG